MVVGGGKAKDVVGVVFGCGGWIAVGCVDGWRVRGKNEDKENSAR